MAQRDFYLEDNRVYLMRPLFDAPLRFVGGVYFIATPFTNPRLYVTGLDPMMGPDWIELIDIQGLSGDIAHHYQRALALLDELADDLCCELGLRRSRIEMLLEVEPDVVPCEEV